MRGCAASRAVTVIRTGAAALALALGLVLGGSSAAAAAGAEALPAEPAALAEQQLEALDTRSVLEVIEDLHRQTGGTLPRPTIRDFIALLRGEGFPYRPQEVVAALGRALLGSVAENLALLGWLVVLAALLAVLRTLQSAFQSEAVARTAYVVIYLALVAVALVAFQQAARTALGIVDGLVRLMLALAPLLIVLLAAVGAVVTAGLFHPVLVFVIHATGIVVARWVVPAVFLATVLDVVNQLPGRVRLSRLAELLRQGGVYAMLMLFTVFLGVMTVEGAAGAVADGVALRTVKFAAGTFVPVLGKMFADATELVVTSSLLLKNAVGLFGAATVALVAAWPLLKVVALVLTFRLAAALVQPLGDGGFADALQAMASGLTLIGVATAAVSLMFFLALTILVGAGNAAVMLR